MTRSEGYAEGFQEGRRWAEWDISQGIPTAHFDGYLREIANVPGGSDQLRTRSLATARGYRDTVARFEAGTLTRQMFEHAPRSMGLEKTLARVQPGTGVAYGREASE